MLELTPNFMEFTENDQFTLKITNTLNDSLVAFKLMLTTPKAYTVKPRMGTIPPGGSIDVTIFRLQPFSPKDKFRVQGIPISPDQDTQDAALLEQLFKNEKNKDLIKNHPLKAKSSSGTSADAVSSTTASQEEQQGATPLHLAALNGHMNIVEFLCQNGADVNSKAKDEYTPLHLVALNGHMNIVELLCQNGADINSKAKDGVTPLHLAALLGHKNVVKFTCQNGADINIKTDGGRTPIECSDPSMFPSQSTKSEMSSSSKNIWESAKDGDLRRIKELISQGANVNDKREGATPLHLAALNGHMNIVEFLCQNGADVNSKAKDEYTPLHLAALQGHKNILEFLDINSKVKEGIPLHGAALNGHMNIVEFLCQNGADINIKADGGKTPIECCSDPSMFPSQSRILELKQQLIKKLKDELKQLSNYPIIESENQRLQKLVAQQSDEIKQISETLRTAVQMNDLWKNDQKFLALNRLLSVRECMINDQQHVDSLLLNESKQLMGQVEQLKTQHVKLNEQIALSKKPKEQELLLSERSNNLNDLMSKLNNVLTVCEGNMDHLINKHHQLDNWVKALSSVDDRGTDQLDGEQIFVNVQDKQFNNLMQQKKNYEESYETLINQSKLYLDCLNNSEQLLNELRDMNTAEEKNKEMKEVENHIINLVAVQQSYKGLRDQMDQFKKKSQEVQDLVKKFNSIKKETKKLTKDIKKIELDIDSDDDSDEEEHDINQLIKKIAEKNEELKPLNQELRKLERDMLSFSHYGEVKAILPKAEFNQSA